jgi:hypothetical protein
MCADGKRRAQWAIPEFGEHARKLRSSLADEAGAPCPYMSGKAGEHR